MSTWTDTTLRLIREIMINMDREDLTAFQNLLQSERACSRECLVDTKDQFCSILGEVIKHRSVKEEGIQNIFRDWAETSQQEVRAELVAIIVSTRNELDDLVRQAHVEKVMGIASSMGSEFPMPKVEDYNLETILSLTSDLHNTSSEHKQDIDTG